MKNKIKKWIDIMGMLLLCLTIVTFNLIVGSNQRELRILPISIFTGICLLILFIKKTVYQEQIIKGKIDIAVSAFMGTLILPLIFKTYCSLQGTVEFILKYFFVYAVYLLARNVVNTNRKKNIIVVTTILASLIIIVLGLDKLHGDYLGWLEDKLNINYASYYRFSSNLGYANTASIYITFCVFLALNRIENSKKIIVKLFYLAYIILGTYIIYISYSRLVLLLYVITMTIYVIAKIYSKIRHNQKILKLLFISIIVIILCLIIYVVIAMRYSKPCELQTQFKVQREFQYGKEYKFEFDIDVKEKKEQSNAQVLIKSVNRYFIEKELARIDLDSSNNKKQVIIKPEEDIYYIKLVVVKDKEQQVMMNHCYINQKEYIFSYKYMPKILSRLITTFSLKDDSIVLRQQFYKNCVKIAKDSIIIGHGGNAWKRLSLAYEDYYYIVKEAHSYFFELLISYGIVGITVFLFIVACLIYTLTVELLGNKEKRKQKMTIFIGLMLFLLYSVTFDFTMSYVVTILMVFIYFAILQVEDDFDAIKKNNANHKLLMILNEMTDWCAILSISAVFVILVRATIAKYFIKDVKAKAEWVPYNYQYQLKILEEDTSANQLELLQKIMINEPYRDQNYIYYTYWESVFNHIKELKDEEVLKYVDFGIERYKNIKPEKLMDFKAMASRLSIMVETVRNLNIIKDEKMQKRIDELKEIITKEYKINKKNIQDSERNSITLEQSQTILESYRIILKTLKIYVY